MAEAVVWVLVGFGSSSHHHVHHQSLSRSVDGPEAFPSEDLRAEKDLLGILGVEVDYGEFCLSFW